MNILVLYTELAGYTMSSLHALAQMPGVVVHVVRWPVNKEAPFVFDFSNELHIYNRNDFDTSQLIALAADIKPDLILCSGWIDKGYLAVCKLWRSKIPVVMSMDNKWQGTLRQHLARAISAFTIRRCFSYAWVPGREQVIYAEKLGFAKNNIKTGFYTCDTERFLKIFHETFDQKSKSFPHVFVYAGRYYDFKGVEDLWDAFTQFKQNNKNDWKLVCLGVGDIKPPEHPDITHLGFIQPESMDEVMRGTGVFILPSRMEPWGVVVQEFGAAGFPLLLSDAVGAGDTFLVEGQNGFRFHAKDVGSLVRAMQSVSYLTDERLLEMGKKSADLASGISPQRWAETLLSFLS